MWYRLYSTAVKLYLLGIWSIGTIKITIFNYGRVSHNDRLCCKARTTTGSLVIVVSKRHHQFKFKNLDYLKVFVVLVHSFVGGGMFVPNQYFFLTSLWNVIRIFAVYGNFFF